ncbi:predicted protein [Postia placenta Mad-698-R]|nr:predicted protein [Postia placenta Mad-698-R]
MSGHTPSIFAFFGLFPAFSPNIRNAYRLELSDTADRVKSYLDETGFASRRIDGWLDNVILPKRVVLTLDPPPLPVEDFSPNFSSISLVSIVNQPEVVLNTDVAPLSEPEECPLAQWEFEVLGYAIKLPDIDTLMCRKCIAAEVALAATWAVLVVLFLFSVILSCIRSFTRCKACNARAQPKCNIASNRSHEGSPECDKTLVENSSDLARRLSRRGGKVAASMALAGKTVHPRSACDEIIDSKPTPTILQEAFWIKSSGASRAVVSDAVVHSAVCNLTSYEIEGRPIGEGFDASNDSPTPCTWTGEDGYFTDDDDEVFGGRRYYPCAIRPQISNETVSLLRSHLEPTVDQGPTFPKEEVSQ